MDGASIGRLGRFVHRRRRIDGRFYGFDGWTDLRLGPRRGGSYFAGVKGKGAFWLWLGVLVVFLAGAAFVGYKLWKRQQYLAVAEEKQRWEVKRAMRLNVPLEGEELDKYVESENAKLDRYEVLRPVIDELDLVAFWETGDADQAMAMLKDCSEFRAGDEPGLVLFVVSDKDKAMAGRLAEEVNKSYRAMLLRERLLPPAPPPGFGE